MSIDMFVMFCVKSILDGAIVSVVQQQCTMMAITFNTTPEALWKLVWDHPDLTKQRLATMPIDAIRQMIEECLMGAKMNAALALADWAQDAAMLDAANKWLEQAFSKQAIPTGWTVNGIQQERGNQFHGSPSQKCTSKTTEPGEMKPGKGAYGNHWQNDRKYVCKSRGKYEDFCIEWMGKHYTASLETPEGRVLFSYVGHLSHGKTAEISPTETGARAFALLCIAKYLLTLDDGYLKPVTLNGDPKKWDAFFEEFKMHPGRASNDQWAWVQAHARVKGVNVPEYMGAEQDENGRCIVVEYIL